MTIQRIPLSGSTHGRGVEVAATATAGTLIHTATSGATDGLGDEVFLYAMNNATQVRQLVIEWGGTTSTDDLITTDIPPKAGLYLVVPGLWIRNSLVVRGFTPAAANEISIFGYVNRVT